jgi:HEAT repeat protein
MQWYCLECFAEVGNDDRRCAACGADLTAQDRDHFGRKLVRARGHRLSDRRILAARALGVRGDPEAVPALIRAAEDDDPYVAAEAVRALASIGDRSGLQVVRRMAHGEGSVVVKAAASEALRLAGETLAPPSRHRPDAEQGAGGPQ